MIFIAQMRAKKKDMRVQLHLIPNDQMHWRNCLMTDQFNFIDSIVAFLESFRIDEILKLLFRITDNKSVWLIVFLELLLKQIVSHRWTSQFDLCIACIDQCGFTTACGVHDLIAIADSINSWWTAFWRC